MSGWGFKQDKASNVITSAVVGGVNDDHGVLERIRGSLTGSNKHINYMYSVMQPANYNWIPSLVSRLSQLGGGKGPVPTHTENGVSVNYCIHPLTYVYHRTLKC